MYYGNHDCVSATFYLILNFINFAYFLRTYSSSYISNSAITHVFNPLSPSSLAVCFSAECLLRKHNFFHAAWDCFEGLQHLFLFLCLLYISTTCFVGEKRQLSNWFSACFKFFEIRISLFFIPIFMYIPFVSEIGFLEYVYWFSWWEILFDYKLIETSKGTGTHLRIKKFAWYAGKTFKDATFFWS